MINLKKGALALTLAGVLSTSALAQTDTVTVDADKEKIRSILSIDAQDIIDVDERSSVRVQSDLNGNKQEAIQSEVNLLNVEAEATKLRYIKDVVPIEVRVLGMEASLSWLQMQAAKKTSEKDASPIWASSEDNLYIPIETSVAAVSTSPVKTTTTITHDDAQKLKELGLVIANGSEGVEKPSKTAEPERKETRTVERAFVNPTSVTVERVVVMGSNKHFSGKVSFDISLSKGKEEAFLSLQRAKVGDKFTVHGVDFVVGDITSSKINFINLENSEVKSFNI